MGSEPKNEDDFPRTTNRGIWEQYLKRKLNVKEMFILENVKSENRFNSYLTDLSANAKQKNVMIVGLTGLYGNCLFESLEILGIIKNHEDFRNSIAFLMKIMKDKKDFFDSQPESLGELFTFMNEIEYVFDKTSQRLYKYTYEAMYRDLSNGFSWTRLPTQLIMMVISQLLNVRIHIMSNTSTYTHEIITHKADSDTQNVYLGHIGEVHYVPLAPIVSDEEVKIMQYTEARIDYFRWARAMCQKKQNNVSPRDKETKEMQPAQEA